VVSASPYTLAPRLVRSNAAPRCKRSSTAGRSSAARRNDRPSTPPPAHVLGTGLTLPLVTGPVTAVTGLTGLDR
jgi:hypothetical protein